MHESHNGTFWVYYTPYTFVVAHNGYLHPIKPFLTASFAKYLHNCSVTLKLSGFVTKLAAMPWVLSMITSLPMKTQEIFSMQNSWRTLKVQFQDSSSLTERTEFSLSLQFKQTSLIPMVQEDMEIMTQLISFIWWTSIFLKISASSQNMSS
jgi:hypothetical protein